MSNKFAWRNTVYTATSGNRYPIASCQVINILKNPDEPLWEIFWGNQPTGFSYDSCKDAKVIAECVLRLAEVGSDICSSRMQQLIDLATEIAAQNNGSNSIKENHE